MVTAKSPSATKKKKPQPSPSLDPKRSKEQPSKTAMADEDKIGKEEKKNKKRNSFNEIDAIFQAVKSKKKHEPIPGESEGDKKHKKAKKKRAMVADEDSEAPRRRTNDGLAIYSAKELGFGKSDAGGTSLCPFDCSCCF